MIIPDFLKQRRCFKHRVFVSSRMADLQQEICNEAIQTGVVNLEKRQKLLKYKEHLRYL